MKYQSALLAMNACGCGGADSVRVREKADSRLGGILLVEIRWMGTSGQKNGQV